jgi:hypothetical protein
MKKLMLLLLLLSVLGVQAQDLKKSDISVSLGYMFEGEVYLWETDRYGSVGETLLIRLEYDRYFSSLGNRFGLGLFYTFSNPWYDGYEVVTAHEVGGVIKVRLSAGDKLLIKPGAYFGYRAYGDNTGSGLGINGSVAFEYQLNDKIKPFVDLGILTQPAGGNDATDITYSPVFQINFGVTF